MGKIEEEYLWLVDECDAVLGAVSRSDAHADPTKIHRTVNVGVENRGHELLLQRRSEHKSTFPLCWTLAASGHVRYGDTYLETAVIELGEETGIEVAPGMLDELGVMLYRTDEESEQIGVYRVLVEGDVDLTPDREEVAELRWVRLDALPDFIVDEPWADSSREIVKRFWLGEV